MTLAGRPGRGRRAAEGAAVRDLDGRTYAAASVRARALDLSALDVCVAMAVSSGSAGLEAAVVLPAADGDPALDAVRDFAGAGVPVHLGDARRPLARSAQPPEGRTGHGTRAPPRRASRIASVEGCARPLGWDEHAAGEARLRESYAALPAGCPVRLAKRTSNLFRGRPRRAAGPRRLRASTASSRSTATSPRCRACAPTSTSSR